MDLFSIPFLPILQDFVFSPVRPKWFIKIKICNLKNQDPELFYFKRMENREIFGKPETYSFCYPIFRPERNHTIVQILWIFSPPIGQNGIFPNLCGEIRNQMILMKMAVLAKKNIVKLWTHVLMIVIFSIPRTIQLLLLLFVKKDW